MVARINELLEKNPLQVEGVCMALEQDKFFGAVDCKNGVFSDETQMMFQIDVNWFISWLFMCGPAQLTMTLLRQIMITGGRTAIYEILEFVTGVVPKLRIPETCRQQHVLLRALCLLMENLGGRLTWDWVVKAFAVDGTVNFHDHGVHTIVYQHGLAVGINRIDGKSTRLSGTLEIDRESLLSVSNNHSDMRSFIVVNSRIFNIDPEAFGDLGIHFGQSAVNLAGVLAGASSRTSSL